MLSRVLIAVAAIAAGVWLGFGLHSARLAADAQQIAAVPPALLKAGEGERALRLFERARARNPDTGVMLRQAGLLARLGREREAIALTEDIVRREPESSEAWSLLAVVARSENPRLSARATARSLALNPPVAPAR